MMHPAPTGFEGTANVVAVLVLLAVFAMLRAQLVHAQVRIYAVQSALVAVLSAVVAGVAHVPQLFVLAGLSVALKVVLIPILIPRFVREADVDLAHSARLKTPAAALIAVAVAAFGLFAVGSLGVGRDGILPAPALAVSVAVVLASLVVIIVRSDVVSQAVGAFSIENGVSVAGLVVAWGLPLILAIVFLFDLLVAVVVFGALMRTHHIRSETLSTEVLDRLKG